MNEFIQSNTAPVCHSTFCDYELSRYDVECLPLETDIIKQLLACVKNARRPQCPLCLFYVDFKGVSDLQNHTTSCNVDNLIPCEYCYSLVRPYQLSDHTKQCRNLSTSQRRQALIEFILPKTKYPLTAQQMRIFIENRNKNGLPLDPRSIVNALAELGKF